MEKKFKTFIWIRKVIESCESLDQLFNCTALIDSYYHRYNSKVERRFLRSTMKEQELKLNRYE